LKRDPNHPGAIHYYLHAVEASTTPERAEPYAERLGGSIPGAGHLVHMPAHIYYRLGRYKDSLAPMSRRSRWPPANPSGLHRVRTTSECVL
jgi:hypothetical protein